MINSAGARVDLKVRSGFPVGTIDLPPSASRHARPGSSEVCSSVSASKEIHSFSGIVRKTVVTRVSINAAMIPTQKSAFAIFAFE